MTTPANLYEVLAAGAAAHPSRPALRHEGRSFTYAEARDEVDALAGAFKRRGVRRGDAFAIVLRNSPEFVFVYLALARLGAVAVPLNFLVTKADELEHMLKDSGAVGFATQGEFLGNLEPLRARLPGLRLRLGTDAAPEGGELLGALLEEGRSSPEHGPSVPGPGDPACILYTSGTTGRPKGAVLTHGNQIENAAATMKAMGIRSSDLFLVILPMFHIFAWSCNIVGPLVVGAGVDVVSSVTPPARWLKLMGWRGTTIFTAVPQLYAVLAKEACGARAWFLRLFSFRRVRLCFSGAGPLSPEAWSACSERLGLRIVEGYGLTETSPVVSVNPPEGPRPGFVGRTIEGVEIRVLDEDERELPAGQEGEICVRGPGVLAGYHGDPAATAEAFTRKGRWFKTGDVGFVDGDGFLKICDRKKDMIIVKGLKVFPAQVELVLSGHPAVAESAVIGVAGADGGEELIKAFVVLKEKGAVRPSDLKAYMKEKLDPYKRPRIVEIVESLPKNALQKVLKRELRRLELARRAETAAA